MTNTTTEENSASRILAAAIDMLADEGYESLSMRKLAGRVGLSQAAIYRHYRNKTELVASAIDVGYSQLKARLVSLEQEKMNPAETLSEGIRRYVDFALESPRLYKAFLLQDLGPAKSEIEVFAPGVSRRKRTFGMLAGIIGRGIAEGSFAPCDPEITAQAVWAAMFGLATRLCFEPDLDRERIGEIRERQIAIIIAGLSPQAG